jgi:hypothetical protein
MVPVNGAGKDACRRANSRQLVQRRVVNIRLEAASAYCCLDLDNESANEIE